VAEGTTTTTPIPVLTAGGGQNEKVTRFFGLSENNVRNQKGELGGETYTGFPIELTTAARDELVGQSCLFSYEAFNTSSSPLTMWGVGKKSSHLTRGTSSPMADLLAWRSS